MVRLISRRGAEKWRFDETSPCEDHLHLMQLLSSHIGGELQVWLTMASDLIVVDRATPASVHKVHPQTDAEVQRMRSEALQHVRMERSSIGELPCIYLERLLLSTEEKRACIEQNYLN